METHPLVRSVGLNIVQYANRQFNDPTLNNPDSKDDWGIQRINAPQAWDLAIGDETTIAIVDSGTLLTHEEVVQQVIEPWSFATNKETMMLGKYINDQSGRVDLVAGHGTHVAITAAGAADNSKGTSGIAPGARIMPIQSLYFRQHGDQSQGPRGFVTGSAAEVIAGITRAISRKVDVINLSLGRGWDKKTKEKYWKGSPAVRKQLEAEKFIPVRNNDLKSYLPVLELAQKHNVILVNAAGNDNLPARLDAFCYSDLMISVAATTQGDQRASFSNYGNKTTVSAPGDEIYSGFSNASDGYTYMPGTSMASPHVAGVVALMREVHPTLTFKEAKKILIETGRKLSTDQPIGPLVNAVAAVKKAKRQAEEASPEDPPVGDDPEVPEQPNPEQPNPEDPSKPEPPATEPAPPKPTPEEIVDGPTPWNNPEVQRLIDLWLSIATPPLDPIDGRPWFYDEWGRHLNNYNVWANYEPDHGGMTRHQYVWQFAKKLDSTRHGTLYEFVLGMLRDGRFDPAPPSIPGKKNPPVNDKNDRDKKDDAKNGNPENPVNRPVAKTISPESLRGQWTGKNGQQNNLGINFFGGNLAWVIRDGNPTAYQCRIDTTIDPAKLVFSQAGKDKLVVCVKPDGANAMLACTYFSTGTPRFREGDQRYTYRLTRTETDPGSTNIARYGFRDGSFQLRSSEQVIVGTDDKSSIRGAGFIMTSGSRVISYDISQNGATLWFMVEQPSAADPKKRDRQIWSMDTASRKAAQSKVSFEGLGRCVLKSSPDGSSAWLLGDTSHRQAVQARREVKIFRASKGGAFQLIADTDQNKDMASLGLAQAYYPNVTADGNSILFIDRYTIWRINSAGFTKLYERDQIKSIGLKPYSSQGFHNLVLSADGQTWIATIMAKRGEKTGHFILKGGLSGNASVAASSAKGILHPRVSEDGNTISYFDYADRKTHLGSNGQFKTLDVVGRWSTFGAEFFNNGKQFYAVIGSVSTSSQMVGFSQDTKSGKRILTHSDMLLGPAPRRMLVSKNGKHLIGPGKRNNLTLVDLAPASQGKDSKSGPNLTEAICRVQEDRLTIRVKLDRPEDVSSMRIVSLHKNYLPSKEVLKSDQQPFRSWGGYATMRPSKLDGEYYEASTPSSMDLKTAVQSATFWICVQSKDKSSVKNYLVHF